MMTCPTRPSVANVGRSVIDLTPRRKIRLEDLREFTLLDYMITEIDSERIPEYFMGPIQCLWLPEYYDPEPIGDGFITYYLHSHFVSAWVWLPISPRPDFKLTGKFNSGNGRVEIHRLHFDENFGQWCTLPNEWGHHYTLWTKDYRD